MRKAAGIHFQYVTDEGQILEKILSLDMPFVGYIVPNLLDPSMTFEGGGEIFERLHSKENYYPDWFKNAIRENRDNQNITWIQEGYRHCCERCFENEKDPYHEHVCLDDISQSLERQIEIISKGKNLIKENLGIISEGYCPPNHMYNNDTIDAAKINDFRFFTIRNAFDYLGRLVTLPAYNEENLIVVPESKLSQGQNSPIIATYYDHLVSEDVDRFLDVLDNSNSLLDIDINKKPKAKIRVNEKLIIQAKKLREFKKKFKR